jgi:PD-(D/E)XK nuclease superfamily
VSGLEDRLAILIDDIDFRRIDRQLRRFNIFEAIGAIRGELKHSNFLSFILSPARSHGLGSEFLLQFVRAALSKQLPAKRVARSIELMVSDLDSAVIYREQDHIDVLVELKPLKLIVSIENKIGSSVGDGQLARYKSAVRTRYPD